MLLLLESSYTLIALILLAVTNDSMYGTYFDVRKKFEILILGFRAVIVHGSHEFRASRVSKNFQKFSR